MLCQSRCFAHFCRFLLTNRGSRVFQAPIGYMDGTVFREVLRSVLEENQTASVTSIDGVADTTGNAQTPKPTCWDKKQATGTCWGILGEMLTAQNEQRAKIWSTKLWPYGSEFGYDTTGQEEVVVWTLYFGYDEAAKRTVDHILSYMRSLPNWSFMGGADSGDVANGGKWLTTAGTGQRDMGKMHYRAGLNQIPLSEWYRTHPDDFFLLEIAVGAQAGQLTNIDENGAPSIYFHSMPHVMEHDAYSGDYGLGFFGISLETGATLVLHPALGPLCYLCDLAIVTPAAASAAASAAAANPETAGSTGSSTGVFELWPLDAYRQRVYLEPLGLWLQADAGTFTCVRLDLPQRRIIVRFAADAAAKPSYTKLRLRADQVSRPGLRPAMKNIRPVGSPMAAYVRAAWELPPLTAGAALNVTMTWDV